MGTYMGHILSSLFTLFFGFRSAYSVLCRYYSTTPCHQSPEIEDEKADRTRIRSRTDFRSHIFYNYTNFLPGTAIDAYVCTIAAATGFLADFATAFEDGKFVRIHNLQHMMMYTAFGFVGIASILTWNKNKVLPPGSDYAVLLLSFVIEALMFSFHLRGKPMIEVHVHQLLIVAVMGTLVACIMEWKKRDNPLAALFRSYTLLLQSSWFCQIAFILYNPLPGAERWLPDDHDQLMLITSLFVLHMLAVLILMFLFASWIHKVYSRPEHEQDVTYHCILADDATDSLSVHV